MSNVQNVACQMQTYSIEEVNSNLLKVSIIVMHEGVNLKESSFSIDSIEKAKKSCKNIPILAFIKRDQNGEAIDFDQHNIIMKIVDTEDGLQLKEYFEEQPIGVIPESNNYRYEMIDGVKHVVVDGYIWKSYSNEAYDLIMNSESKSVSMEIAVNEGVVEEDGLYNIKDYTYLGVTILGDCITPGMGFTCNLTKYSKNVDFDKAIKDITNEVDAYLEREVNSMDEVKVEEVAVETEPTQEPEAIVGTVVETEEAVEEVVVIEESEESVQDNFTQDSTDETIVEEVVEAVEDAVSVSTEEVIQTIEEVVESVVEEVVEPQINIVEFVENFAKAIVGELDFSEGELDVEALLAKSTEKFNHLNEELNTLRAFKQNIEDEKFKAEVELIFADFNLSEDETVELKAKALNGEMTIQELTKELYALEGMKVMKSKKKFSTDEVEKARVSIQDIKETSYKPYGGILG